MIADVKIYSVLEAQFPQLLPDAGTPDFYHSFRALSRQVGQWIHEHELGRLEQCLRLVDKLYRHSSNRVRNAIENVFIYRIIHPIQQSHMRYEIKRAMPESLREMVYRHLYNAAI